MLRHDPEAANAIREIVIRRQMQQLYGDDWSRYLRQADIDYALHLLESRPAHRNLIFGAHTLAFIVGNVLLWTAWGLTTNFADGWNFPWLIFFVTMAWSMAFGEHSARKAYADNFRVGVGELAIEYQLRKQYGANWEATITPEQRSVVERQVELQLLRRAGKESLNMVFSVAMITSAVLAVIWLVSGRMNLVLLVSVPLSWGLGLLIYGWGKFGLRGMVGAVQEMAQQTQTANESVLKLAEDYAHEHGIDIPKKHDPDER